MNRGTAWAFANSGFGLWFFSVVFVSGAGSLYTLYQANAEANREVRDRIEKLDLEISYRYSQLLLELNDLHANASEVSAQELARQTTARVKAVKAKPKEEGGLYAEFDNFSLIALAAELSRLAPEADRAAIVGAIADLSGMIGSPREPEQPLDAGTLVNETILPRWKRTGFYFVECSSEKPFC